MKTLRAGLVLLLSYCLGVQPAVAQIQSAHLSAPVGVSAVGASAAAAGGSAVQPLAIWSLSILRPSALNLSAASLQSAPAVTAAPAFSAPVSPAAAHVQSARERIAPIEQAAAQAAEGIERAGGDASRSQAAVQFSALTGERLRARSGGAETPASFAQPGAEAGPSRLSKAAAPAPDGPKAEPPAPKSGITRVFKDPVRNGAFWRYVTGYSVFLFGFQMYVVGMPYLISAITRNSLNENHDARAGDAETVKSLIRSNRSLSRIAHWIAQGLSYITIPLFARNVENDGPKKWLVRSTFIRAGVLALVPVLFFTTGFMSMTAALGVLLALIAAQSFFQGISVTMDGAATTRIMGASGVTADERTKANSIITFVVAVIAIIAPAIAGQIALIGPIMGKDGVGGAVIYGIYAGTLAVAAFIYATIKLIGGKREAARAGLAPTPTANAPNGLGTTLKELWVSIKDGTKIVVKDRLLRVMLILSMVSSLFSDPLIFNVLPEYIESIVAGNPGSIGAIMNVPVLGAFLRALTSSPMGNFALMMVMTSVGSIVAAALIKPLTKLFKKFGFKTEEALTLPFYVIAALEAPLFFLMIGTHTILGVVLLYGLQSLVVGFIGISISGLYQKNLGGQKDKDVNKILAAQSLLGIAAAIISTFAYGFLLKDIAIGTSLAIAAAATGVMALLRLFAPFLSFTKAERHPPAAPSMETIRPGGPRGPGFTGRIGGDA
ncbi:MAG: hypothetical protein AAB262_12385 [Elusimicrobiota bacterium]